MNMSLLTSLILVVTLAISEGTVLHRNEGLSTGEQFVHDIHTVEHNLKESVLLKKKAVVGAFEAVGKAKLGIIKDTKEVTAQVLHNVASAKLAKLEAIKAAKQAFLDKLTTKLKPLTNKNVPNNKISSEKNLSQFYSFLYTNHADNAQNLLYSLIKRMITQLPSFSGKEIPAKDYIKIGDTEYVFVPVSQKPLTNEQNGKHHEKLKFSEDSTEGLEPVSHTSSTAMPLPSLPPAPTLPPMSYNTAARAIDDVHLV